jgi:hypothetical protein
MELGLHFSEARLLLASVCHMIQPLKWKDVSVKLSQQLVLSRRRTYSSSSHIHAGQYQVCKR